jgi:hypothetical protein
VNLPNSVSGDQKFSGVVCVLGYTNILNNFAATAEVVVAEGWYFEATMQIKIRGNFLHLPCL